MDILDALNGASRFAAERWQAARREGREEEQWLWMRMNEFRAFIGETGQAYRFETYLGEAILSTRPPVASVLVSRGDTVSHRLVNLVSRAFDESPEPQQKQSAFTLIGMINFLADTGQLDAVEDYVNHRLEYAPLAIACFTTQDEAKAWLGAIEAPMGPVRILIGNSYFTVCWAREINDRRLYRDYVIEPYLQELAARGVPVATPTFSSQEEAGLWLEAHPASPFAFVSIGGEPHVAVHHRRLGLHTLHPVAASLLEWERMKAATERD